MVLPLLPVFGLLAASAAVGQAGISGTRRYFENRDRERYKEEIGGLLKNLPEGAGPDQTARALATAGLLSPEAMMQYGFGQQEREEQFGYDWELEALRQREAWNRLGAEGQRNYAAGRQEIINAFQPQLDALNRQHEGLTNIIGIAKEAQAMSPLDYNRWIGSPEGRAVMAQLTELETAGFYDFKRQVYGDAEPPAHVLEDLQNRYKQFTQGGILQLMTDGRFDLIGEIYGRRLEDVERRAEGIEQDYYRNLDGYEQNNLMIPGRFAGSVEVETGGGDPNMPRDPNTPGALPSPTRSDRNLIMRESGGDWGATNDAVGSSGRVGHFGRAQFGEDRLDEAREGLNVNFSTQEFLRNPALQRAVEAWHFNEIEDYIQDNGLDEYIGGRIGRIPITLQGMLNVAHLGGKRGLSRFLATGGRYNPRDSNGTHLSDYLALGARS